MLDSTLFLSNVASVNNFDVVDQWKLRASQVPDTLYLRLWQSDLDERYIPAAGSTVQVKFLRGSNVSSTPTDQTQTISFTAAFADDRSIWKADLTAAQVDKIASGGVQVVLVEGGVQKILFQAWAVLKIPITGV